VAEDPVEKRNCLEEALALDPPNPLARRGLAILDGRLDPKKIIDPDRQPVPRSEVAEPLETQRFVCQKCGGKMAFRPDGRSLQCEYCGHTQTLMDAVTAGAMVQEQDFIVAMATAKGHTRPVGMRPFSCEACGASFLLAPGVLSLTCSYCGSAHVGAVAETRQLIPPEGVIPFAVSQQEASQTFREWLHSKELGGKAQVTPVRGLYLPAWTFDLSGEVRWQCYAYRDEGPNVELGGIQISVGGSGRAKRLVREEGSHLVYEDDLLVPASHKLPAHLVIEEAKHYLLTDVVPYEEGYLADWPAEVYAISVSDASLVARREVLEGARSSVKIRVGATLGAVKDLQFNSQGLIIESFKLILLPVWVARYRYEDKTYHVLINGQTGGLRAEEPRNWLQKLLGGLFD
jgi:DNA-directed RNA polymerase subunit RPC12/RpoP